MIGKRLLCLGAALLALSLPLFAAETDLGRSARAAFAAGQVEIARMLAIAALNAHPEDPEALAVLAAIGLVTRAPEAAKEVAVRSFNASGTDEGRFTAARLAAKASYQTGHGEVAKYWMRRAVHNAPDEVSRSVAIEDFRALRRASPLQYDIGLSVRPSDNVNQGARDALLTVDGRPTWFYFDGATRALSGVEAQLTLGARYRIAGTPDAPTELGLRVFHRGVMLSQSAKAQAPGAKGSDFANSALDLTLFRTDLLSDRQSLRSGLTYGRNWLSGDPHSDRARIETALTTRHAPRTSSRLGLAIERQWQTGNRPAATAYALDAGVQHLLESGDRIALTLDLGRTVSADLNQENTRLGASLRYARGRPVAGALVQGMLGVTARDYPVYFNGLFNDTGRQDLTVNGSIEVALPKLGAMGFEPVVSIEASRTRSNISRYDGRSLGLGLRIQSSF